MNTLSFDVSSIAMAKHKPTPTVQPSKMTVMVFQFEGSDATLQEGLKTIASTLSRALPSPVRTVAALVHDPAGSLDESNDTEPDDEDDSGGNVDQVAPPTTPRVRRSMRSPAVLDIDLGTAMSLKEFLDEYDFDSISKKYLLIAHWFKVHRQTEEVSMDHIHTCFRHMSWQTPRDALQPLRDMKNKNQWFHKGGQVGHFKINHVGENEVMKLKKGRA